MLILKGTEGKSRVIDALMMQTDSICFVYYDYSVIPEAFYVDSKEYSLQNFLECVSDEMHNAFVNDKHYDYLLVYTNQNEEDLHEIIKWINENRCELSCRDIVLTCK